MLCTNIWCIIYKRHFLSESNDSTQHTSRQRMSDDVRCDRCLEHFKENWIFLQFYISKSPNECSDATFNPTLTEDILLYLYGLSQKVQKHNPSQMSGHWKWHAPKCKGRWMDTIQVTESWISQLLYMPPFGGILKE